MRAEKRFGGVLARAVVALCLSVTGAAFGQGFQDALGPGAESRALGGAISAGVSGAQATFVNPAGLGRAEHPELYLGIGLQGTNRTGSPEGAVNPIGSEVDLAPLPALALAVPITRWLVLGGHAAPASFQGAAYRVDVAAVRDARSFRMVEAGPDVSLTVPEDLLAGALCFGFGYRVTAGGLDRFRGPSLGPQDVALDLGGVDVAGIRAGIQYSPVPELRFGVSWQNRVSVVLDGPTGRIDDQAIDAPQTIWTIPARVTIGLRLDVDRYGLALEYRLADYSTSEITYSWVDPELGEFATRETGPLMPVHTGHLGGEYRLSRADYEFPLRFGYTIESRLGVSVSPFDTPPDPLSTISVGGGVHRRSWGTNLAANMRFGGGAGHEFYEWSVAIDFVYRLGG